MNKDLQRQFIWHLRYIESLFDATLDVDVAEENLKTLAFHTSQLEKSLSNALSTRGGGSVYVLFAVLIFMLTCRQVEVLYQILNVPTVILSRVIEL